MCRCKQCPASCLTYHVSLCCHFVVKHNCTGSLLCLCWHTPRRFSDGLCGTQRSRLCGQRPRAQTLVADSSSVRLRRWKCEKDSTALGYTVAVAQPDGVCCCAACSHVRISPLGGCDALNTVLVAWLFVCTVLFDNSVCFLPACL